MNKVFLCLGGNLGNRLENIENALQLIRQSAGSIIQTSAIYETQAWGSSSKANYLNLCVELSTKLSAASLLKTLLTIEKKLGRLRGSDKNADRTIDIDILFFNNSTIENKSLQVPHPRLHLRKFVLVPLNEIAAEFIHPRFKKNISTLLKACKDKLSIKKYKDTHSIICIEGNIGSGKTTLAIELAHEMNAALVKEQFEDNALLPLFYKDSKSYALALETSFLISRFEQLTRALNQKHQPIVCDFSIYKSLWFAKINLTKADYKHFKKMFDTLASELPKPTLIVHLKTSPLNLKQNIKKRARVYEQTIRASYLKKIDNQYQKGLKGLKKIPQLHITVKSYNSSTNHALVKKVRSQLK